MHIASFVEGSNLGPGDQSCMWQPGVVPELLCVVRLVAHTLLAASVKCGKKNLAQHWQVANSIQSTSISHSSSLLRFSLQPNSVFAHTSFVSCFINTVFIFQFPSASGNVPQGVSPRGLFDFWPLPPACPLSLCNVQLCPSVQYLWANIHAGQNTGRFVCLSFPSVFHPFHLHLPDRHSLAATAPSLVPCQPPFHPIS